jgi:hypothetical protein
METENLSRKLAFYKENGGTFPEIWRSLTQDPYEYSGHDYPEYHREKEPERNIIVSSAASRKIFI